MAMRPCAEHARTLDAIERAVAFIPDVMVEMPVGPHDGLAMKELLVRLDAMGVRGVNLLEFGFPLCNAEAFAERGLELRQNPYPILYNYWYAGRGCPSRAARRNAWSLCGSRQSAA